MRVDTVFLAILHLSGASFREFYENKIPQLKIIWLRRWAGFWCSHTSLMDSSTSPAASKHSEEMCTYLGFIPQQLLDSCTSQPRKKRYASGISMLDLLLKNAPCNWELLGRQKKAGSVDGMETHIGNISQSIYGSRCLCNPAMQNPTGPNPFFVHTSDPQLIPLLSWTSCFTEPNATHSFHKTKK